MFELKTNTRKLRDSVKTALRGASGIDAVFYRRAPATQAPPFVVFLLDLMTQDGCISQYLLTVECSSYGIDDDVIDDLADNIQYGMEDSLVLDDTHAWDCWCNSRQSVDESDKNILRRRIDFTLRYIGGEEHEQTV